MCNGVVIANKYANEIRELLIRDTLDIQKELSVTPLDFGYRFHVDLPGPDGESLYLKVEVRRLNPCPSPPSPWFKEERELLDCEDPFVVVPPNGLRGHAIQQAQVVTRLRLLATDTLKWAVWAVPVKNNRWRLR